jgi:hypothetical protein
MRAICTALISRFHPPPLGGGVGRVMSHGFPYSPPSWGRGLGVGCSGEKSFLSYFLLIAKESTVFSKVRYKTKSARCQT